MSHCGTLDADSCGTLDTDSCGTLDTAPTLLKLFFVLDVNVSKLRKKPESVHNGIAQHECLF